MQETSHRNDELDLNRIQDPDVRRALRSIHQQMTETMARHQLEIDAIIETMLEKHIGSVSELRRQILKLQQNVAKGQRLHEQLVGPAAPAANSAARPVSH
jgi:hypothetical protein